MAGPKLSKEQKAALRSELRERLADGERVAFVVAEQAVKYSITPNTVRWHLKRLEQVKVRRPARVRRAKSGGPDPMVRGLKAELDRLIRKTFKLSQEYMEGAKRILEAQLELSDALVKSFENGEPRSRVSGGSSPVKSAPLPAVPGFEPFGKRVKDLRKAAGLTLEVVATRMGTHKGYISGIENRTVAPPSPKFVRRFGQVYGVDERELLRLAEVEKLEPEIRDEVMRALWPPPAP